MNRTKIAAVAVVAVFIMTALVVPAFSVSTNGGSTADEINSWIRDIDYYPDADIAAHYGCEDKNVGFEDGEGYAITIKYTKKTASANGDKVLSNNANVETIAYPGAILVGDKYLADNNPARVTTEDRANITLTTSLPIANNTGDKSYNPQMISVNPKEYGDVSQAIVTLNERWKVDGSAVAAQVNMEETEAHSTKQTSVSLGVSIPQLAELGLDINWESSYDELTYVVNFTQVYYTISVTPSPNPSDYFGSNTTLATLQGQLYSKSEGRYYQGVIVNSVSYGRTVIASITSKDTSDSAKIALEAAISGTEESLSTEQKNTVSNATVKYYVYGGVAPTKTLQTMDDIREFLGDNTITADNISTAKPIQYCTTWIDYGNSSAKNNSTSEYNEETITQTQDITYKFDFDGGYVGRSTLKCEVYDSIDKNGDYVNLHEKKIETGRYYCQTHHSETIDAKHKSTMYLTVEAVDCTDSGPISDKKIYPLESIYYKQGGTACDQSFELKIDGSNIDW